MVAPVVGPVVDRGVLWAGQRHREEASAGKHAPALAHGQPIAALVARVAIAQLISSRGGEESKDCSAVEGVMSKGQLYLNSDCPSGERWS